MSGKATLDSSKTEKEKQDITTTEKVIHWSQGSSLQPSVLYLMVYNSPMKTDLKSP